MYYWIRLKTVVWKYLFHRFCFFRARKYVKKDTKISCNKCHCHIEHLTCSSWETYWDLTIFSRSGTKSFKALKIRESFDRLPYNSYGDREERAHSDQARIRCKSHNVHLKACCGLTSRKEMAAGSSCSRYVCVEAQRRARMRALLLLLSAYSSLSCSEPGGDVVW